MHHSDALIGAGAILNQKCINAVVAPATGNAFDVKEGSIIKAIYLERWLVGSATEGIASQFTLTVEKKRDTEPDMTFAQSQNLGAYPNKKNILYTTQGIVTAQINGGPTVPVIRQYVLIPKGKQRFGLQDEFMVNIGVIQSMRQCGIDTFKEFT